MGVGFSRYGQYVCRVLHSIRQLRLSRRRRCCTHQYRRSPHGAQMKMPFCFFVSSLLMFACSASTDPQTSTGSDNGSGGAGGMEATGSSSNSTSSSASSSGSALCNATNCANGCCMNDLCTAGTSDVQCGTGGQLCQNCTTTNGSCHNKTCTSVPQCNATSCPGCCLNGTCEAGLSDQACGKGGQVCLNCSNSGRACVNGYCM